MMLIVDWAHRKSLFLVAMNLIVALTVTFTLYARHPHKPKRGSSRAGKQQKQQQQQQQQHAIGARVEPINSSK
jgi:hypothetical protein